MPTQPSPQVVRVESVGGKTYLPSRPNLTTSAPSLFATTWQIGAAFSAIVTIAVPALAANGASVVSQGVPLTTFPASVQLAQNQNAVILASATLSGQGVSSPLIGAPVIALRLGAGAPAGTSPLSLSGPGTFGNFTLSVSVPVSSATAAEATSVAVLVTALLVGA